MPTAFHSDHRPPTLLDVLQARPKVYRYLKPTPLYRYGGLSDLLGTNVWVKHENHQPVGAFKVRGGLNLAANLSEATRQAGLITASTGNHGQSIAFAGQTYGIPVTIAMPEKANLGKAAAIQSFGAQVKFVGADFDEAREWAAATAQRTGAMLVGPAEPDLIAGVGTYALEILHDLPEADVIFVPVGSGSGAAAVCTVAKAIKPSLKVIAVQSAQAPAAQLSWQAGHPVPAEMNTFAEGIATRVAFDLPQLILQNLLDDFVLVDDEDIKKGVLLYLKHTHNLIESACSAALVAAVQRRNSLRGKNVVLIASGGNLAPEKLHWMLNTVASLNIAEIETVSS